MKILQVIPVFSDSFGGPVRVVRSISKELAKSNQVTIYTTSAKDQKGDYAKFPYEIKSDGNRVVFFPRVWRSSGFNISPIMAQYLRETIDEYDVVHVHSWRQFQDVIVHHYAVKRDIPYVLQAHGSLPRILTKKRLKWVFDVLFGYRLLRDASKVIALSGFEAEQYRYMGVANEKIVVIPNGVDVSDYANLPPKGSFKKKFGIEEDEKIVLYLGRLHKSKDLGLLAEAYSVVTKELEKVRLVVVGPDDGYASTFSVLASHLGIERKILLTGFLKKEDKFAALVDSDVFVTPNFHGFPISFLEACLAGCPIVTTSGELDWIHENVGYVVKNSQTMLANAISGILQDESMHARFKRNCEYVNKNFDIATVTARIKDTYKSVV